MSEIVNTIEGAFAELWPYVDWLFYILFLVFVGKFAEQAWLFARQNWYKRAAERTLFEIKIPREITRGPKAMDQFFSALHAFMNVPGSLGEKYWDGETTRDFSFELLGVNGSIHMFMRVPRFYSDAIKAALYSQYNDLEIVEQKNDYMDRLPRTYEDLHKIGYEIWGMEAGLERENYFPVKTYAEFEEKSGDERIVDPIAFFIEVVNNMPDEETIMVQFVMKPIHGSKWQDKGEKHMEDIHEGRKIYKDGEFMGRYEVETEQAKQTAKSIHSKIAKEGFKTLIRYIHVGPTATFNMFFGYRNFFAFFNQLSSDDNAFVKNHKNWTKIDWFIFPFVFPRKRLFERRKKMYKDFLKRYFPEETWLGKFWRSGFWIDDFCHLTPILNTEELATLFHPPTEVVITTGLMDRVESKRIAPPSDLPA
ncbi:MAG: hypothetical protein ABH833_01420 [Parcubacteria group bacterium]